MACSLNLFHGPNFKFQIFDFPFPVPLGPQLWPLATRGKTPKNILPIPRTGGDGGSVFPPGFFVLQHSSRRLYIRA
jgi:hypothetical protein